MMKNGLTKMNQSQNIKSLLIYTIRFLSVDWITTSIRPILDAWFIVWEIFEDCSPYALLIKWKISWHLHNTAISSTRSGARGAKQLVVLNIQTIFSGLSSFIFVSSVSRSVLNSSPINRFSIMIGMKPLNKRINGIYTVLSI